MAERLTPFGKYFLLERINVGGMAEVYKAKTLGVEGFEKVVAIKRILPSVAEDEEFIKMFVDEAKITSQLSHANLAQTFDLGKIDDTFYIAMEYVPGKDLRAVFERMKRLGQRMPLTLAAYVVSRVCEGLDYAHRKRDAGGRDLHIVHRDVSPQNIILSYEGEVKLIDFGIAKAANKITKTQAGILKGKFGYMSPEQVRGMPLDGRSDIFAAGVVLYELATSERLFTGSSDFSVLEKVQQAKVPPPTQVEPSIPLKLERILLKALAREPEDRYPHAADLAAELQRFLIDSSPRPVTREDLAAFMKATFPDDERRDGGTPVRRPPPRVDEAVRVSQKPPPRRSGPPPPLPASLTADLDPERTLSGGGPVFSGKRAEIIVKSKLGPPSSPDLIQPGDSPTKPMNMNELAAAERDFAQRGQRTVAFDDDTPTPKDPPRPEIFAEATPVERPTRQKPREQVRPTPPPPVQTRARWLRTTQIAVIAVLLAVALWAVLSTPRPRSRAAPEPIANTGSLTVTLVPPDAQLSLDGTQVKNAADAQWSDSRLTAGVEHTLTARREGYVDHSSSVTLLRGDQKSITIRLKPTATAVAVLSSPPNAAVYLDGERKGVTPAYLGSIDPAIDHAITVEKKCYRSWQVVLPAGSGPRQIAATLQAAAGACPGSHLETTGMPSPPGLPDDAPVTLGFLNLGSRPSAQVIIDGVDVGQTTPLLAWPLRNGPHQVKLVGGGRTREVSVDIRPGETHSEIVDLARGSVSKRRARR